MSESNELFEKVNLFWDSTLLGRDSPVEIEDLPDSIRWVLTHNRVWGSKFARELRGKGEVSYKQMVTIISMYLSRGGNASWESDMNDNHLSGSYYGLPNS